FVGKPRRRGIARTCGEDVGGAAGERQRPVVERVERNLRTYFKGDGDVLGVALDCLQDAAPVAEGADLGRQHDALLGSGLDLERIVRGQRGLGECLQGVEERLLLRILLVVGAVEDAASHREACAAEDERATDHAALACALARSSSFSSFFDSLPTGVLGSSARISSATGISCLPTLS